MKNYRLPKMGYNAQYDLDVDIVGVSETEPGVLSYWDMFGNTYEQTATISNDKYVLSFINEAPPGEYGYYFDAGTERLLYGSVRVQ